MFSGPWRAEEESSQKNNFENMSGGRNWGARGAGGGGWREAAEDEVVVTRGDFAGRFGNIGSRNVHPPRMQGNFQKNCCLLFKFHLLFGSINHFEFWFVFEEPEAVPGLGLRYFKIRHRLISWLRKWVAVVREGKGQGFCR